jgi:hypothetical protein
MMRKSAYLLAILVAAVSTAAVAKDLKQGKKSTAPTVTASQMSDAEMDKVTAGDAPNQGGPYSVSVGAAGLTQEVGGPFTQAQGGPINYGRFSYNGYYNSGGRGAQFLVPQ